MASIDCPCCGASGFVIHGHCNGNGCGGCVHGELVCDVCECGKVDEPLWCPHADHLCCHNKYDDRVLVALIFLRVKITEEFCLDHAREDSVDRRWAEQAKACTGCGTYIIWRHESGRRVCLDSEARAHACDPEDRKKA